MTVNKHTSYDLQKITVANSHLLEFLDNWIQEWTHERDFDCGVTLTTYTKIRSFIEPVLIKGFGLRVNIAHNFIRKFQFN